VGVGTSDDAGVYALPGPDGRALVQTVDYFTPIVDDAGDWGRIAAANALSDVYAMGATPLTALQLLGWPRGDLPLDLAGEVMAAGADTMTAAGCVVVGGHSIDAPEPSFGYAVTGLVPADRVVTNAGARAGDHLVITKPLGTGIITTAHKAGACPPRVLAEAVEVMSTLNRQAGEALHDAGAHAATDVTGFGLLGHLAEMLDASGVGAKVGEVPVIEGVAELLEAGYYPGGSERNLESVRPRVKGDLERLSLLADAQTSGGLLVAVPDRGLDRYLEAVPAAVVIGEFTARSGEIVLT
jgi:selenide, water dikinase